MKRKFITALLTGVLVAFSFAGYASQEAAAPAESEEAAGTEAAEEAEAEEGLAAAPAEGTVIRIGSKGKKTYGLCDSTGWTFSPHDDRGQYRRDPKAS